MTNLDQLVSALIIGGVTATGIIHLQDSAAYAAPITADAINCQNETVETYAKLFPESAAPAVEQWAARKATAELRQSSLEEASK